MRRRKDWFPDQKPMDAILSPEQVHDLEALIHQADEQIAGSPPLLPLRLEEARDLAIRMLHSGGSDATKEERHETARLIRKDLVGEEWTDGQEPRNAKERRRKRASDLARTVALGWLGHPGVAREVAAAKPALLALVEPLGMPGQLTVTYVTAIFLDAGAYLPDGTEWPNPFAGAPAALLEEATRIRERFVDALGQLAIRIESTGARLDPQDPAVLLVLAQLCLLDADLTRPAAELVDDLNIWPPGSVDREAATQGHVATRTSRHGRNARFQADLVADAEFLTSRLGPPAIRPPYAGGQKRRTRQDTLELRRALEALVRQHPSLTPGALLEVTSGDENPVLAELRAALGGASDDVFDRRRLERNWPKSRQ